MLATFLKDVEAGAGALGGVRFKDEFSENSWNLPSILI
jgi:hypothetical protein